MLWNPDFIRTIFPENNLVATLMINDDRENEEKIFFKEKLDTTGWGLGDDVKLLNFKITNKIINKL